MKICSCCVMDTTDPEISFDENGVCNHCTKFKTITRVFWPPDSRTASEKIKNMISQIKASQKSQEYDAVIGVSGGMDSSYLAYWAVRCAGLRILALHVDTGWDSEIAIQNIENLVKNLGIELHTCVIDWEAMRQVQLAFFKAGVSNQDIPQDHAIFSTVYEFARKNKIPNILKGGNLATESVLPEAWGRDAMDTTYIKDVCKRCGVKSFKKFPLSSFFKNYISFPYLGKIKKFCPLNSIPYSRKLAIDTLSKEMGWKYYGPKHYESRFTKFFQGYWLPQKYKYDKRKAHLSSLILSGEISREEALKELEKPSYNEKTIKQDIEYVSKKLKISPKHFIELMRQPNERAGQFKTNALKKKLFLVPFCFLRRMFFLLKNPRKISHKVKAIFKTVRA